MKTAPPALLVELLPPTPRHAVFPSSLYSIIYVWMRKIAPLKLSKSLLYGVLVIIIVYGSLVFALVHKGLIFQKLTTEEERATEISRITAAIQKHFLLPSDEIPTLATVTDAALLAKSQVFFINAQEGDRVLLYTKKRQAILYRPDSDLIVNVGPIQYGQSE